MSEYNDFNTGELLRRLGIPKWTFYPWLRGEARPPWRILQKIKNSYRHHGRSPLDVVKDFWKESVGDACPCGCGGILPDDPKRGC